MSTMTTVPTTLSAVVAPISLAPAEPASIHLTRRGRLLITALVLVVLASLLLTGLGWGAVEAASNPMVAALYPDIEADIADLAENNVLAHLAKLRSDGKVKGTKNFTLT